MSADVNSRLDEKFDVEEWIAITAEDIPDIDAFVCILNMAG